MAFKYYCLFQHHVPPPVSTFTTSAPQTMQSQGLDGAGADPSQLQSSYVSGDHSQHDSFILGARPGPYIAERSRSVFMRLGARLAILGIDARTERTSQQVNYSETYHRIFKRVNSELLSARFSSADPFPAQKGGITHLMVLLGVPMAFSRLKRVENIFVSSINMHMRSISKRFGVAGGFLDHMDGKMSLLDDLNDHYTARQHKSERKWLMLHLQDLAEKHGVRITILSGDVHLAAVGRFYSNPRLGIPAEQDHRYMANIISSAIARKPPPKAVADLLAKRNKIHHLDDNTDETLMILFDKNPGTSSNTASWNKRTMPSRNYAIISESCDMTNSAHSINSVPTDGHDANGDPGTLAKTKSQKAKSNHGFRPLHPGERDAGSKHPAASGIYPGSMKGGLDVCFRVEIDQHDKEGRTEGYGFSSESKLLKRVCLHPLI